MVPPALALCIEGSSGLKDNRLIRVKMTRKKQNMPTISLRISLNLVAGSWLLASNWLQVSEMSKLLLLDLLTMSLCI